jgi:basic amino acid/polyamine antiporter, APA family
MNAAKIPKLKAILICINSMIGAGLFINPKPLTQLAGPYGFLVYLLGAVILLPLILSVAELARMHPVAGGLYVYSREYLGPWAGFLAGWSYFLGKTTTLATLMHKFVIFFQARVPSLIDVPTLAIDFALIAAFALLNTMGVSIGGRVQYLFTAFKAIPLLFTFWVGTLYFNTQHFAQEISGYGLFATLPVALFALLGFEVICAIGNMLKDPAENIKKVILSSFLIVTVVNITFQLVIFGLLGMELVNINEPLLAIGYKACGAYPMLGAMINGAVFVSVLGAFYSLLTSNYWNLYTIAWYDHLPFKSVFMRLTKTNVPWAALGIQVVLACCLLTITADQIPLQNMSVCAQICCYLFTVVAAFVAAYKKPIRGLPVWIPALGILTCFFVMGIAIHRLIISGVSFAFIGIFIAGCFIALTKKSF